MAKADFYETLGVSKTADEKELKSAFRKMAMKYHPDKNPGDASAEQKFKDVNEAYEMLKDPQKRAAYDRYGHAAFEQGGMGGGFGGGGFGGGGFSDIFEDIFGEMMGGGRQRRSSGGRERGANSAVQALCRRAPRLQERSRAALYSSTGAVLPARCSAMRRAKFTGRGAVSVVTVRCSA